MECHSLVGLNLWPSCPALCLQVIGNKYEAYVQMLKTDFDEK